MFNMSMKKLIILLLTLMLGACAMFPDSGDDETENWSADRLYNEAKSALDSEYYTQAVELYEKLQIRYPFGIQAQQSQLDLAYAYYKSEEMPAAVAACNRFIKLYPANKHVDYAFYLKGLAHFHEGKGLIEKYLPNDASQRDPGAATKAFQDFAELLRRYPESEYAEDSTQRMTYLRNILARHEVNVAKYYMRRGAHVAAANRGRFVIENYPRAPAMPDALVIMAKAYKVMEMNDLSEDTLRVLQLNYPDHPGIREIQEITVR